jgi:hypothetical protein
LIAVAWAECGLVVSAVLALIAFARELDCLFFCTEEQNETGAGFAALLGAAAIVLVGGFVLAARASGWGGWRAVGQGVLGVAVLSVVLLSLSSLPVPTSVGALAIGLGGIVSIRAPAPRMLRPRLVAVLALAVLGLVVGAIVGGRGELVLVLATLPALAIADSVVRRREEGGER